MFEVKAKIFVKNLQSPVIILNKSQPRHGTQLLWLEMTLFSQKEKHEIEKHS